MRKIPYHKFIWILVCWIIEIIVGVFSTGIAGIAIIKIYEWTIPGGASDDYLTIVGLATIAGVSGAFLSLIPSYFISVKLAKLVEKKWNFVIQTPGKLYALSLIIPILLFFTLFFFI